MHSIGWYPSDLSPSPADAAAALPNGGPTSAAAHGPTFRIRSGPEEVPREEIGWVAASTAGRMGVAGRAGQNAGAGGWWVSMQEKDK